MKGLPPLARAALALSAGIVLAFRLPVPFRDGLFLWVALSGAAVAAWPRRRPELAALAVGVLLGLGGVRSADSGCLAEFPDGAPVQVRGALAGAHLRDATLPFLLERTGPPWKSCREVVRVRLSTEAGHGAGQDIVGRGRWLAMPADGPWPRPAIRRGLLILDATRPVQAHGHPLLRLRGRIQLRIRRLFGANAPLGEALILARKEGLDPERRERFARAGLSHLLAISGLHVGIIFGLALILGRMLGAGKTPASVVGGAVTLAYVLFLGAPHSAVRAAFMILLFVAARLLQRPSDPFALLAAAATVILVLDPLAVLDVGFQLSFAGAGGIVALRDTVRERLPLPAGSVRDGLVASVAATLATAPVAAFHFGRVAPVGILANLLAIPLVGLAVPATALAVLADLVSHGAGHFLAGGATVLLDGLDAVAVAAHTVPGGHAWVTRGVSLALGLSVAVAIAVTRGVELGRREWSLAGGLAVVCIASGTPGLGTGGEVEVHAIDVGQGDAIAIRSPRGRWILVDAGPRTETWDAGRRRVVPYLLARGARRLEALILTHPDGDHVGGAAAVLEALDVRAVLDPGHAAGKSLYVSLLARAEHVGVQWFAARAGRRIELDGVVLDLLHPVDGVLDVNESANEVSVVLRLEYGTFSALLLGDASAAVERVLLARHGTGLEAEVIKVGHHGSATSTTAALLDAAGARVALIPVGRRNRYGHPHRSVLERLRDRSIRILRTDENGSVTVRATAAGRLEIETTR